MSGSVWYRLGIPAIGVLILFFPGLVSCGKGARGSAEYGARERLLRQIQTMEQRFQEDTVSLVAFSRKNLKYYAELLEEFVKRYPEDTLAPQFFLRLIGIYNTLGATDRALALTGEFLQRYGDHPYAPDVLFMRALLFHELRQVDSVRAVLDTLQRRYPDYPRMADVQFLYAHADRRPEEWLQIIRQKAQATGADTVSSEL